MSHILGLETRVFSVSSHWMYNCSSSSSLDSSHYSGAWWKAINFHKQPLLQTTVQASSSSSSPPLSSSATHCNYVWLIWPVNLHYCTYKYTHTHTHSPQPNTHWTDANRAALFALPCGITNIKSRQKRKRKSKWEWVLQLANTHTVTVYRK